MSRRAFLKGSAAGVAVGFAPSLLAGSIEQMLADWTNPPSARFLRNNTQSVPHNTVVKVSWDNLSKDTFNVYDSLHPSRIAVPYSQGITQIRATANLHFENRTDYLSAVGMIGRNGGAGDGFPHVTLTGYGAAWAPQINLVTDWIQVTDGDYFELVVLQRNLAGAPAALIGAGLATWLAVEYRR